MLNFLLSPIGRWVAVGILALALWGGLKYYHHQAQVARERAAIAEKTTEVQDEKRKVAERIQELTPDELAAYYRTGVLPPRKSRSTTP